MTHTDDARALLERAGLDGAAAREALARLEAYAALLLEHNRATNLIGKLDREGIWSGLLIDALLPAGVAPPTGLVLDVGSGAGLPGIPLAIAFPDHPVLLIEPRRKRVEFLQLALRELGIENARVVQRRLETLVEAPRGEIGCAAAKAFAPPLVWMEAARPWVRPGGLIYLYLSDGSWDAACDKARARFGLAEIGRARHPLQPSRFGLVLRAP